MVCNVSPDRILGGRRLDRQCCRDRQDRSTTSAASSVKAMLTATVSTLSRNALNLGTRSPCYRMRSRMLT
jgi:hypothetical protein